MTSAAKPIYMTLVVLTAFAFLVLVRLILKEESWQLESAIYVVICVGIAALLGSGLAWRKIHPEKWDEYLRCGLFTGIFFHIGLGLLVILAVWLLNGFETAIKWGVLLLLLNPIFFAAAVILSITDGMITKSVLCLAKKLRA